MRLVRELRRRRVFRTAALYIVGTWLVLQVSDVIFPALDISERAIRYLLIGAVTGFPFAIVFGWFFDITPQGIRRTPSVQPDAVGASEPLRRSDYLILGTLLAVVGTIAYNVIGNVAEEPGMARQANGDGPPMVAVLPFASASLEGESGFFAHGVHDDLLTQLAQLEAVRVISRTSVLEYKDTTLNIREIGAALGADAILEGGVQSMGNRIRINAQLIDARSDEHLWAQTYDRELSPANIFEVQTEIARAITAAMHTALTPQDVSQLTVIPTENMAAYRAYRHAMEIQASTSIYHNPEYLSALEKAVALDPGFTRALAELAGNLAYINFWGEPDEKQVARSEELLETLRELAPDSADHLIAQAYYSMYILKDYDQTFEVLTRAERKAPSDLKILHMKSWVLRRQGKHGERNEVFRQILKLDPRNEDASVGLIRNLLVTRNYDQGWQELQNAPFTGHWHSEFRAMMELSRRGDFDLFMSRIKSLQQEYKQQVNAWKNWETLIMGGEFLAAEEMLDLLLTERSASSPGLGGYRAGKLITYWFLGKQDLLQQTMDEVQVHFEASGTREAASGEPSLFQELALFEVMQGNKEMAKQHLRQWRRESLKDRTERLSGWGVSCQILAIAQAVPEAVECLQTGFEQPTWIFPFLEPFLPYYDLIRDTPEFQALMVEVNSGRFD